MELQPFAQHLYENGYSRQEELTFRDCDRNKKMRVAAILGKMAVFGGFDYDARGLTHEKLLEMRHVFLLARASFRVHRCPVDRQRLTIRTWEDTVRGVHMRRVYEMRSEADDLLISAKSDWVLVDPVTRKLLRPSAFTARTPGKCPKEIDCPDPKKIRPLPESAEELGTRRVVWSDLDGNGHLFSGNYGDVIWDFLPESLQGAEVETFAIQYSKEASLGDTLYLRGLREGDTYRMEGDGPEGLCFAAEMVFAGGTHSGEAPEKSAVP